MNPVELTPADLLAAEDALRALFEPGAYVRMGETSKETATSYFGHLLSRIKFCIDVFILDSKGRTTYYITDLGIPLVPWFVPNIRKGFRDNWVFKTWFHSVRSQKERSVAKARIATYKEELMAATWHPRRVERLLLAGGFEALDD